MDEINSVGYVVDVLEANLWIIFNTDTFPQAIIGAINLGSDTDTTGAVTGAIAGIIYGIDNIPNKWLDKLLKKDYLLELADKFEKIIKK